MNHHEIWRDTQTLQVPPQLHEDPFNSGNITLTGNGYLGYRGTFPDARRKEYVACTVSDTYDMADGTWKELCTVPNGLYLAVEGHSSCDAEKKQHGLQFSAGRTFGSCSFSDTAVGELQISFERFASLTDLHCVIQQVTLRSTQPGVITIRQGIDGDIWSLNGNHFRSMDYSRTAEGFLVAQGKTTETALPLVTGSVMTGLPEGSRTLEQEQGILTAQAITLTAGEPVTIMMIMSTCSGNDASDPYESVLSDLARLITIPFCELLAAQQERWDQFWDAYDIHIETDPEADCLLRYNMYHNRIATPAHTDHLPIGARGLSCQAYQGAAFWDQEIYNMPMYTWVEPETAKRLLLYRYRTLQGAREKAAALGYTGAFYPWISGQSGKELCPDYFFKDVLTGRKIRNHFNDWQIHISPDIGYALLSYFHVTGDLRFMREHGLQMLLEISLFIYSRVMYNTHRQRYEILCVLGPDEYHEKADNNTFTNYQCRYILQETLKLLETIREEDPAACTRTLEQAGVTEQQLQAFEAMSRKLFVHSPDPESGLIEQFDGYFDLEDITPAALAERLIDDQEYWGWPNGIAYETQVTKQADVVQLFMLHPYPVDIMRKNYRYYEQRTQHRSSLSPGVHAIVAANCGMTDQAYTYFMRSCSVDIGNTHPPTSGGTFIGGIHTAACGIAWQIVTKGFCGLQTTPSGISLSPHLPEGWSAISFNLTIYGSPLKLRVSNDALTIEALSFNGTPIEVSWGLRSLQITDCSPAILHR
jgi:1,2-alpha-glucosylglycerol phosphorylase